MDAMEKTLRLDYSSDAGLRSIGLVLFGSALIALGSMLRIPLEPVPFTLQTLAICWVGLTQTPKEAFASATCYLLWASLGLPVLAGIANPLWISGQTGGYLIGFPVGAALIAWLRQKRSPLTALIWGQITIFAFGWIWLASFMGVKMALIYGVLIFLPSEAYKIAVALAAWRMR